MPPRFPSHGVDDLVMPAYFAAGADAEALAAWKREHPDWFIAGHWTPGRGRNAPSPEAQGRRRPGEGPVSDMSMLDPATISLADLQAVARAARAGGGADPAIMRAQARPPSRRAAGGFPVRSLAEELRELRFQRAKEAIRRLEPDNPQAATLRDPARPMPEEQVQIVEREAEAAQARANAADPATPEQRQRLRRELERTGQMRPGDGNEAHHMVPQGGSGMTGDRDPREAQEVLRRYGIGLDEAANGVALSARFHRRIHATRYYEYVNRKLSDASSGDEARLTLHLLQKRLRSADQDFQRTGEMPNWAR